MEYEKVFNYINLSVYEGGRMFDIVTFGSGVVDVFVDTEVSEKNNFLCYNVGSKILIKDLKYDVGGGGTNTAVAFSRLGFKTGYIGKVGDDNNGKEILDCLKKEKVSFLGSVDKKDESGYSIILDSKANDRTVLTYKGANNKIKERDVKNFETKWLYFSSLLGESLQTQKKLAEKLCKDGKTKLAFNPSSYLIKKENLNSILKLTTILMLNKEEAQMLSKKSKILDIIKVIHSIGPEIVVITDKDKDIFCSDKVQIYKLTPHKVKVVERTGAGDAFASGFVSGIMLGWDMKKSLHFGLEESESVIQYFGAKNKLIKRKIK